MSKADSGVACGREECPISVDIYNFLIRFVEKIMKTLVSRDILAVAPSFYCEIEIRVGFFSR